MNNIIIMCAAVQKYDYIKILWSEYDFGCRDIGLKYNNILTYTFLSHSVCRAHCRTGHEVNDSGYRDDNIRRLPVNF